VTYLQPILAVHDSLPMADPSALSGAAKKQATEKATANVITAVKINEVLLAKVVLVNIEAI